LCFQKKNQNTFFNLIFFMDTPNTQATLNSAAVTGAAVDPTNGTTINTVNAINNFDVSADLEITLTNSDLAANVVDFPLFCASGRIPPALPANFTVTSPFPDLASLRDYVKNVPIQVVAMQVDTNDPTSNYSGNIKVSERKPNNTLATRTIRYSDFRLSNGGGDYQNVLNVNNGSERFTIGPSVEMVFSTIKFGTSITIRFTIPANGRVYEMAAVKY
jgi:hypothetical protein